MLVVGIKTTGKSSIKEAVDGIQFKKCVTFSQLDKCEIALLENCKDEDLDKVQSLHCKTIYSMGAVEKEIKLITQYIDSPEDILGEAKAIQNEKRRTIEKIKEINEEKLEAQAKEEKASSDNAILREKLADKTHQAEIEREEKEKYIKLYEEEKEKNKVLTELKDKADVELKQFKTDLGNTIIQNKIEKKEFEEKKEEEHNREIQEINLVLQEKNDEIERLNGKINDYTYRIEELSKQGSIPEINYKYQGDAKIITVVGQGSYGVSNLAYSLMKILTGDILLIDFDTKGGNLNTYTKKESYALEEMTKTGELKKETLIRELKGRTVEYIGGFKNDIKPSDIVMLDYDKIFEGNWDYIIVDGGIYGGYNIQTVVDNMLLRNGNIVNIHIGKELKGNNIYNIQNFSRDGIPKMMQLYGTGQTFYDIPTLKAIIEREVKEWTK